MLLKVLLNWFVLIMLAGLITACQSVAVSDDNQQQTMSAAIETISFGITQSVTARPSPSSTAVPVLFEASITPPETVTPAVSLTPMPTFTPTPDTRPDPRQWASWPVVPTVSERAKQVYQDGLNEGNDPKSVSVIGDCQSEPNVFLGIYATDRYILGDDYQYLQETIDYYRESFSRRSFGVRDGLSAPSALSTLWADPQNCLSGETPVTCELRAHKPAILFINLGTNWKPGASAKAYEDYLRQIVEQVIANGTLPILSTKADNIEGDHSLNLATARVAYDYDIPLWNFWLAADSLPNHGLDANRENIYLTPEGWDRRNFTALQTLDAIRRSLNGLPLPN
jgi:hypothetical protein